jgi:hypothetical protein
MTSLFTAQLITDSLRLDTPTIRLEGEVDWDSLLTHADRHSLTPLLAARWQEAGALSRLPPRSRARLEKALTDNARRQANVRADLLEIDSILTEAGVPHLVLKGWPLVERLYADPAHRVIYDHDFLVPEEAAQIGHWALLAAGFRRLPAKDEWVEKHLPSVWRNEGYQWNGYLFDPAYPRPVELHVRLWETGWRGLAVKPLPDLWADAQTRTVAGRPMRILSDENTAIHLAMHFAGHLIEREARLNQLLDLARFLARAEGVKWEVVASRAEAVNVARFLYASLWLAREIFGSPLPPPLVWEQLTRRTPPAFRRWLAEHGVNDALTSDYRHRRRGKDYELTFISAVSVREKLEIMRFAALPPMGQLMAKYDLRHRWLAPLFYPRHLAERLGAYGRALLWKN